MSDKLRQWYEGLQKWDKKLLKEFTIVQKCVEESNLFGDFHRINVSNSSQKIPKKPTTFTEKTLNGKIILFLWRVTCLFNHSSNNESTKSKMNFEYLKRDLKKQTKTKKTNITLGLFGTFHLLLRHYIQRLQLYVDVWDIYVWDVIKL